MEPPSPHGNGESSSVGVGWDKMARGCQGTAPRGFALLIGVYYIFPPVSSASRTCASVKLGDLGYFCITVR